MDYNIETNVELIEGLQSIIAQADEMSEKATHFANYKVNQNKSFVTPHSIDQAYYATVSLVGVDLKAAGTDKLFDNLIGSMYVFGDK